MVDTKRKPSRRPKLTSIESLGRAAECLETLAHPHRLCIVQMLLGGRYTVGELAAACKIPSHMASEHLRLMQRCGLFAMEKEGRRAYYTIAEPHLANIMACIVARFGGPKSSRTGLTLLFDLRRKGDQVTLIDVRTPAEFGEVHVDFTHNIPLDRLDVQAVKAVAGDGPVYFVCKSGSRSRKACEKLLAAGLEDVISVEGGTAACEAAGVPVVRGRTVMSLERQVRIVAGALVAIGAALAASGPDAPVNWKTIGAGLAGFVGCGLVFAGITDTCDMAMLLARMPWNQVSAGSCRTGTTCGR